MAAFGQLVPFLRARRRRRRSRAQLREVWVGDARYLVRPPSKKRRRRRRSS